jgi:NNP family nitrate/nitrite transporter-like MFS transporter
MAWSGRSFHPLAFLVTIWAVNVCSNAFYIGPASVFPWMIADLGIGNAQAGALISSYLLSILLFQIPAGYVIDRRDPRTIVSLAPLTVLPLSLIMFLFPVYNVLLTVRFLAGIPVAFLFVPSAFLVSRVFADRPGRAVGLFFSAAPAGVALGNLLGPSIAVAFGWRSVFIAFTLPWLVLVPLFAFLARDLPPQHEASFALADYVWAFRDIELWKVGAVFACSYAAYAFYASWTTTYLDVSGIGSPALLGLLSAAIPAAGVLSRPIGGNMAETRFSKDKRVVPVASFVLLIAIALAIPFLGLAAIPLLIAGGFLANFPFSVFYILSAQIMPPKFTGTAYAFMNTVSLIGGTITPALAGYLVDVTGAFVSAFLMMAATAVLGLALVLWTHAR